MSKPISIPVRKADASEMPDELPVDDAMRLFILENARAPEVLGTYCWC